MATGDTVKQEPRRPATPLAEGAMIDDRYKIVRELGRGGFATVYEARNCRLPDLRCAIKVLDLVTTGDPGRTRQRFRQEARMLASLRSPHIVGVSDYGMLDDGRLFIVMEYVESRDLGRVIEHGRTLRETDVVRIATGMLRALVDAHDAGVVHRDIKPANVLLDRDPTDGHVRARVGDFGIAKVLNVRASPIGPGLNTSG